MSRSRTDAEALDRSDPLAFARERFSLPEGVVYLDGNSLGALPSSLPERMDRVLRDEWGARLAGSWSAGTWFEGPTRVGDKIARLIGAHPGEVVACDTTTIALTKVLLAALDLRPDKSVLLTTSSNFPTDLYAGSGVAHLVDRVVLRVVEPDDLTDALAREDVAVLFLTHVDYRTGAMFDMASLSAAAHEAGALAVWDLCHSAGAVELDCEGAGADMALGCGYKYLNGGPGAPAFLYVRREHQDRATNRLPGWIGHADPFSFALDFRAAPGIAAFVTSSPPVLGLTALEAGLDAFSGVELRALREKSVQLGELFLEGVLEAAGDHVEVASPLEPGRRGSQVSLRHPDAPGVIAELARRGIVGDFRPPDICRFGLAPLYLTYAGVHAAAAEVADVVSSGASVISEG
jgi:kynureninase